MLNASLNKQNCRVSILMVIVVSMSCRFQQLSKDPISTFKIIFYCIEIRNKACN